MGIYIVFCYMQFAKSMQKYNISRIYANKIEQIVDFLQNSSIFTHYT